MQSMYSKMFFVKFYQILSKWYLVQPDVIQGLGISDLKTKDYLIISYQP